MNDGAPVPRLRPSGDSLLLVELGDTMALDVHVHVVAMAAAIRAADLAGVRDVVPAYTCVGVHIDPLRADLPGLDHVVRITWQEGGERLPAPAEAAATWEIPVCYGGTLGPDLGEVATFAGCSEAEVVRRHTSALYHVYMLGFLPGFAYMGTVDASIAMPRRASPRAVVPAGSVGIAGRQTGVYPSPSPGGWRLIGRTPWRMFDVGRASPALLGAGDTVRFVNVPEGDWSRVGEGPASR